MDNGYIFLFRSLMETSFYKNPKLTHLAVHLMMKAAWADHTINLSGKNHVLKRGQFVTGRNRLSEETGLSPQEIRTCIRVLEKDGFLTIKSTNKYSIITVSNYKKFQDYPNGDQPSNQPAINQQSTSNQPLTNTINKGNKEKPKKSGRSQEDQKFYFKTKTACPDDFYPTDSLTALAVDKGFTGDLKELVDAMKDHHITHGNKKNDWVAAARTWLGNHKKWHPEDFQDTTEPVWANVPGPGYERPAAIEDDIDERWYT